MPNPRTERTSSPDQRVPTIEEFLAKRFNSVDGGVKGLLPAEGLGILVGADKSGKSIFNIQLGICMGAGIPFLGRETLQCPVLLVEEEGSPEALQERLARVAASLGVEVSDVLLQVIHRSRWRLDDLQDVDAMENVIRREGHGLVVMASLAQLADLEDENKVNGFNRVARNLLDVAGRQHTSFLVAHHRRKTDQRHRGVPSVRAFFDSSRGSNALTAAMDVGLGLNRDPESPRGELLVLGRDIAPSRLPIRFDADRLVFETDEGRPASRQQSQLDVLTLKLRERGNLTAAEAAEVLVVSVNTAKARLELLVRDGVAEIRETPGSATVWALTTR